MDKLIQSVLYASRWILAPIYLGLIGTLVAILLKFYFDVFALLLHIAAIKEKQLVLTVLGLIDLTLVGGLVLMVMLSGYENFISNRGQGRAVKYGWLGRLDANALKLKVAASIVAISSIHLLQVFMSFTDTGHVASRSAPITNTQALIYIALHLTFVVSACLMGWLNLKGDRGSPPVLPASSSQQN